MAKRTSQLGYNKDMSTIDDNKKTVEFYEDMLDYFEELNSLQAKVGVHAEAGEMNVKKALWNEFGTKHVTGKDYNFESHGQQVHIPKGSDISVPARPFIRLYLYPELVDKLMRYFIKDVEGKLSASRISKNDAQKTFKVIGKESLLLMREKMYTREYNTNSRKDAEYNAPLTVKLKGKDMPLFDTADMYNSMDYKVERRGL